MNNRPHICLHYREPGCWSFTVYVRGRARTSRVLASMHYYLTAADALTEAGTRIARANPVRN